MADKLRHKTVAVAVLYDQKLGFLLWNNKRWGGYAFPMKHIDSGDDPADVALAAIQERGFPVRMPKATVRPLEYTGAFGWSEGVKVETYYDYHVFEVEPGTKLNPAQLDPDVRFFSYAEIQAAVNVTWSTRVTATSVVEGQEVVLAIIHRQGRSGLEFLLVHHPHYGYFFPAIRRKTHAPLEELAIQAVRFDTQYTGPVTARYCCEHSLTHRSARFGARTRRYGYYLCGVQFPGVDLTQAGNRLANVLGVFQAAQTASGRRFGRRGFWSWFTVKEMKTRPDMSPDVAPLLPSVIQCAERDSEP